MTEPENQDNFIIKRYKMLRESITHVPAIVLASILITILVAISTALISPINRYIDKRADARLEIFRRELIANMVDITNCGIIDKFQIIPGIDEMENPFLTNEIDKYDNKTGTIEKSIQLSETSELEIIVQITGVYRSKAPEALKGKLFAKLKINGIEEMSGFEQIPADEKIKPGYPFTLERQLTYKRVLKSGKYDIKSIGLYWGRLETAKMVMSYTVSKASQAQTGDFVRQEIETAKNNKMRAQEKEEYTGRTNLNRTQPSRVSYERPLSELEIPFKGGRSGESTGCSEPGKR